MRRTTVISKIHHEYGCLFYFLVYLRGMTEDMDIATVAFYVDSPELSCLGRSDSHMNFDMTGS